MKRFICWLFDHNWFDVSSRERKCLRCSYVEILVPFKIDNGAFNTHYRWRAK